MATALSDWLPRVLPVIETWMSPAIPPGSEWRPILMEKLRTAKAAIACVTTESQRSQWLNFEAGVAACADTLFPLVLDDGKVDGPLEGHNFSSCSPDGIRRLVLFLNSICERPLPEKWVGQQFNAHWKELAAKLEEARRAVPDTSGEVYEDAIEKIRQHLAGMEDAKKVDVVTFYVRDDAAPKGTIDFYLEAPIGLRDRAPMFGPIVSGDFRKKESLEPEFKNTDAAKQKAASEIQVGGRATTFPGREEIAAFATFRDRDDHGEVRALLNLNWRGPQKFPEKRKQQLGNVAKSIFKLLPSRPFISLERSRMLTRELRAHRYLGATQPDGNSAIEPLEKMRLALAQFFPPDEQEIDVEIISFGSDGALEWLTERQGRQRCASESDCRWVQVTTKPLFLKNGNDPSSILVPMRVPPELDTCRGIIVVRERPNCPGTLRPEMVRPLCSLGDTFGAMLGPLPPMYEIAGVPFRSRLWACTAQNFRTGARSLAPDVATDVLRASGTDILITYIPSIRELQAMGQDMCSVAGLDRRLEDKLVGLACTNLAATAQEAVEKALRGIGATGSKLIKLEVLDDFRPVDREVVSATKRLMELGYRNVIPFVSCDIAIAEEMLALEVPALRILASEIGSGRGIDFPDRVRRICERSHVPVIVEGGIGEPAHGVQALRLGATAILVNSAIIRSTDPVMTATAFKVAVMKAAWEGVA